MVNARQHQLNPAPHGSAVPHTGPTKSRSTPAARSQHSDDVTTSCQSNRCLIRRSNADVVTEFDGRRPTDRSAIDGAADSLLRATRVFGSPFVEAFSTTHDLAKSASTARPSPVRTGSLC